MNFKKIADTIFKYCPLNLMYFNRRANNRINKLLEQALRWVHDGYDTLFSELPAKDGLFTVHHTSFQMLSIQMYKIKHNFSRIYLLL